MGAAVDRRSARGSGRAPVGGTGRIGGTSLTRVRREPQKAVADRAVLHEILDAGFVAHVGILDGDQPVVVPVGYGRDGERLLFHGSTGSRLLRRLAAGLPACATVTLLDGIVYARSGFNSSMNYRSAMVFGQARVVPEAEKTAALRAIAEHLMPGRWPDIRPPSAKELAATLVVELPLDEVSVKVSTGPPDDDAADLDRPIWAGVVPLHQTYGEPVAANDYPLPAYLRRRC